LGSLCGESSPEVLRKLAKFDRRGISARSKASEFVVQQQTSALQIASEQSRRRTSVHKLVIETQTLIKPPA
jgi:negative regulator of replication initiation